MLIDRRVDKNNQIWHPFAAVNIQSIMSSRNFHRLTKKATKWPYQSPGNRRQCAVLGFPFINLSTKKTKFIINYHITIRSILHRKLENDEQQEALTKVST